MRRIIFTTLAVVSFVVVVVYAYEYAFAYWAQAVYGTVGGARTAAWEQLFESCSPWKESWWVIPSMVTLPGVLLAMADHDSPGKALRDPLLHVNAGGFLSVVSSAFVLGDSNGTPRGEEGLILADWMNVPETEALSPFWLIIPITLSIALVIGSARWRAARDPGLEAAGEDE